MLKIRSFNQLDNWLENKDLEKLVPKKMQLPRIDAVRVKKARGIFDRSKHEHSWEFLKNKNNITHVYASQTSVEMQGFEDPVRFVQFIEVKENLKSGKKTTSKIWIITTSNVLTLVTLWKIIHARWGIKNNVFRQLKTEWHMDHCFVHDEIATEAILKFMIIAFNLMQLFFFRRLKKESTIR